MGREDAPDAIEEGQGIVLGPEVDVEGVELVVVLVLVLWIEGGQVPLVLAVDVADGQGDFAGVAV